MRTAYNRAPNVTVNLCTMGGSQSGEAEREVTVEEQERDDGQPQIIVTQDFLRYVQDQQEGVGKGEASQNKAPPPYPHDTDELPRVTAEDLITDALPSSKTRDRGSEEARIWQRKYELERMKNADLKHVTSNQFAKTVSEVREKFSEADVPAMLPVCEDRRNEVLQCYHSNPGKPLLCSQEVEVFISCVERARKGLLGGKQ